jgi:hypothetical protein
LKPGIDYTIQTFTENFWERVNHYQLPSSTLVSTNREPQFKIRCPLTRLDFLTLRLRRRFPNLS